ncbi:acyltransferase domain-containing protein, partial [Candidatus Protofrankia californiensis]|uniref:acyltransferase domain-containing protein n=1 Tax=Candidatus Protofrankia californiensis TaxID=1839754 RepID=UPI0013EB5FD7
GLDALAEGQEFPGLVRAVAGDAGVVAFLFAGQGVQRLGMGRQLCDRFPAFAEAFDDVCAHLDGYFDRGVRDVVFAPEGSPDAELLSRTDYTQAALFALETALFRLVRRWGLQPGFLLGHSLGELTAAHAAGVLDLADACALVAARGRLMHGLPPGGAMIALQAAEEEVLPLLAGREEHLSIAAVNGPMATVVSGEEPAAAAVAAHFEAAGRKATRLRISLASHSPLVDGMLAEFGQVAQGLSFAPPRIPIVSTVTGEPASAADLCTPGYWVRNVREAVRFCDGVRQLQAHGVTAFLELGPDGVLSALAQDCLTTPAAHTPDIAVVPALAKDQAEPDALLAAAVSLHVRGAELDWDEVLAGQDCRPVRLSTYAFVRRRHWVDVSVPE